MHPSISINTLSLAPAALDQQMELIARLGLRGFSPVVEQIDDLGAAAACRSISDAGLVVATLTHREFGYATPGDEARERDRLKRSIATAAKIGAGSITITTGGRGKLNWEDAATRFAEAIAPCAEEARSAGVTIAVEPTSHLYADASIAHRLSDTLDIARRADVAITLDIFACWFDRDIDDAVAAVARRAVVFQISDYVPGDRSLPCRAVPGDGAVPFERIVPALVGAGFTGWYDLEIIGPRLQEEGQERGLARAAEYIAKLIETATLPAQLQRE